MSLVGDGCFQNPFDLTETTYLCLTPSVRGTPAWDDADASSVDPEESERNRPTILTALTNRGLPPCRHLRRER